MITVKDLKVGIGQPLTIIAGPCVIENAEMIWKTAEILKKVTEKYSVQFIFKSSYKKANRTSIRGFSGLAFEKALAILKKVTIEFDVPVLTDVHNQMEVPIVGEIVDILQIPAFLSRQTELLSAAGNTGKAVNIKKGQFLAPEDMFTAAEKVSSTGNTNILLTERGTTFGYRNLVVDMRSLLIMEKTGYPVVFDATHSVQIPGGLGNASGGQPEYILPLAKAAIATGAVSVIFMEVHPEPPMALSDAASQFPLNKIESAIEHFSRLYKTVHRNLE
jgi:2-dehydro-3-deoxyphosphooctonate aldolase (KDO 8-P synthase)